MKVLLINTYYAYGSTGNIVQDLYLEGTKMDWKCMLFIGF